jgi:hypothetical protein
MLILNQEHSEEITKLKASLNELVHVESNAFLPVLEI